MGKAGYEWSANVGDIDLLGLAPTMTFTKEAPFSTDNLRVKATTVKDGKQVMISDGWIEVPPIPKWIKK